MHSTNPLTQKVNFYISVSFIFAFGLFVTFTLIQVINDASLFDHAHASVAGMRE